MTDAELQFGSADKPYGRQIVRILDKSYGDKLYGVIRGGQTVRKIKRMDQTKLQWLIVDKPYRRQIVRKLLVTFVTSSYLVNFGKSMLPRTICLQKICGQNFCGENIGALFVFVPKICQNNARYTQDIPKICPGYVQDMPKICPSYSQDMPKICPRYPQDIQSIQLVFRTICPS